jgi:hypothetical protein
MLYNQRSTYTYEEIMKHTNLEQNFLHQQMMFLFNPKLRLLAKENTKVPKCTPTEKIEVNAAFANPNLKCSFIPQQNHKKTKVSSEDQKQAREADDKEIKLERQNIIDAVVVRIMKVSLD